MTQSRTPKIAKVGLAATAVALGSSQMLPVDAAAAPVAPSDTLQVGTQTPSSIFEGAEGPGNSVSQSIDFGQSGQSITGTRTIVLTEPGSTAISDIVTATISITGGEGAAAFQLTVSLTSDTDSSSLATPPTVDETIAETGAIQNLSPDFTNLFDLNTALPAINVTSDVDPTGVPEPASFSIFGAALAAFGWLRRRRKTA